MSTSSILAALLGLTLGVATLVMGATAPSTPPDVSAASPTVARPTCCLKQAYCCSIRAACCR